MDQINKPIRIIVRLTVKESKLDILVNAKSNVDALRDMSLFVELMGKLMEIYARLIVLI